MSFDFAAVDKKSDKPSCDTVDNSAKEAEIFTDGRFGRLFCSTDDVVEPPLRRNCNKTDVEPLNDDEDIPNDQSSESLEAQHGVYVVLRYCR